MDKTCRNCGAPLRPDDKFCSACGTEVDASLDLTDDSQSAADQPNLVRAGVIFFFLAAASTLIADFVEVQLAIRASWDIESRSALYLVYASLATGIFVILRILWWRILGSAGSSFFGRRLAIQVLCLVLGVTILFFGPIMAALYDWSQPKGPIWFEFDLLAALLATLLFAGYLALQRRQGD
jgi:hypothetical protein